MNNQPNNPPAYPCKLERTVKVPPATFPDGSKAPARETVQVSDHPGMTLRDYFAAKAMSGMLSNDVWGDNSLESIAENAYIVADDMLAAREGGGE